MSGLDTFELCDSVLPVEREETVCAQSVTECDSQRHSPGSVQTIHRESCWCCALELCTLDPVSFVAGTLTHSARHICM